VLDAPSYNGLFTAAVWLVFLFSVAVLVTYMHGMRRFRARVRWIYDNCFPANEQEGLGLGSAQKLIRPIWVWGRLSGHIFDWRANSYLGNLPGLKFHHPGFCCLW
jgi:hypothetical protein